MELRGVSVGSIVRLGYLSFAPGFFPKLLGFFDVIGNQEVVEDGARFYLFENESNNIWKKNY